MKAIANKHKVTKKQWAKWTPLAQVVFNAVYREISTNQTAFSHPKAKSIQWCHWKAIAWNSAWIAASHVKANQ